MTIRRILPSLLITLFITQFVDAQQSKSAPEAAHVPPAIEAAKKVFISNAGEDDLSGVVKDGLFAGGPDHFYDEFYQQIEALKRFEIVSNPGEADIVLEIQLTPIEVRSLSSAVLRLRILDPKTGIVLWSFYERAGTANLKRTLDKNLGAAIERIVSDVKSVAVPSNLRNP
jgi:hypothetical protein